MVVYSFFLSFTPTYPHNTRTRTRGAVWAATGGVGVKEGKKSWFLPRKWRSDPQREQTQG